MTNDEKRFWTAVDERSEALQDDPKWERVLSAQQNSGEIGAVMNEILTRAYEKFAADYTSHGREVLDLSDYHEWVWGKFTQEEYDYEPPGYGIDADDFGL